MSNQPAPVTKPELCALLRKFIAQRSGLSVRDYGTWEDAKGDYTSILKHGRDARALLREIELWVDISVERVLAELPESGRLSYSHARRSIDYTTGQYFPTEYRAAVCRALAGILWHFWIDENYADNRTGVQKRARSVLGRGIASRWFN